MEDLHGGPSGQIRSGSIQNIWLQAITKEVLDIDDEHEEQPEAMDSADASCLG